MHHMGTTFWMAYGGQILGACAGFFVLSVIVFLAWIDIKFNGD